MSGLPAGLLLALAALAADSAEPARAEVDAVHRAGRTYLTFPDATRGPPGTRPLFAEVERARRRAAKRGIAFVVEVRAAGGGESAVREVPPLSRWNLAWAGRRPPERARAHPYALVDDAPIGAGRGLAVFAPAEAGERCYRVLRRVGSGDPAALGEACVDERPGPGDFVRQRVRSGGRFHGVDDARVERFVRWEGPPHANRLRAIDYLVAEPPGRPKEDAPAGLFLHAWGGDAGRGYGVWHDADRGAVLLASNQEPYDWWAGYHERLGEGRPDEETWARGKVRPYTRRRLLAFLDWAVERFHLDEGRVFLAGSSMGGTGASLLGVAAAARFVWVRSDVGVHVPRLAPRFARSFRRVWGRPGWGVVAEEGGAPVYEHLDNAARVRASPGEDLPLIAFANGVDDENVGWAQAVRFWESLQEARQPHVFTWGQRGHRQRARLPGAARRTMPLALRTDRALPAFTGCTLDDDPGPGRPGAGDPRGQVNLWLMWGSPEETADAVRIPVWLAEGAPAGSARVDVTPRRLQQLKLAPGESFSFASLDAGGGRHDEQTLTVDEHGRLTARSVEITREKRALRFTRRPAPVP